MRPINLIPPEQRRSGGEPRTGPFVYLLVGALAVILIGVITLALTSNSISDSKNDVAKLEAQKSAIGVRAAGLAPYTSFNQTAETRTQTVTELADSRFAWPRVIEQLGRVLPDGVYLTQLTGSAGGGSGEESAGAGVVGPSLTMTGCGVSQETVAALVASLKEIDGVTRVGLNNSSLNEGEEKGKEQTSEYCSRAGVADFEIVVVFDAAPPGPDGEVAVAEAATEAAEATTEEAGGEAEPEAGEESSDSSEPGGEEGTSEASQASVGSEEVAG